MSGIGTLIAVLPLLVALFITLKKGTKAFKGPMSDDDKEIARECGKAILYLFAAMAILWWFTPSFGTGLTIFWTILTALCATVVVLTVVDLPDRFNSLHNRIWTEGRKTPLYSMSGEPVEYIRWTRRFMLVLLVLVAIGCGAYAALSTSSSANQDAEDKPTVTAAPATPTADAPAPETSAPATSSTNTPAAPATFKNECGGLDPEKVPPTVVDGKVTPRMINFKTGRDAAGKPHTFICHDGEWKQWSEVSSTAAPAQAELTYWIVDEKNPNQAYGVVVINNTPYLFWTTAIKRG